jgi:hypothetical protein
MQGIVKQRGITLWGIAFVIFVGVFFLFLAFKLVPPYMTDWNVASALKHVANQPGASGLSPAQLRAGISKQFDIDYINSMDPYNIQVSASDSGATISADYSVEVPLMANISALLYFNHQYQVR